WTAILAVQVKQPTSADELRKNPLGLHIDGIDWSKELDTAEPKPAAASPVAAPAPASDQSIPLGSPLDPNLTAEPSRSPAPERTSR
ncbi:MAG TPA: VirB8/TrbF family protein, partial [Allosphingosinicella sp.]